MLYDLVAAHHSVSGNHTAEDADAGDVLLRCEAFLLDMDGTLVDSTAVVEAVWAVFAREHGLLPRLGEILLYSSGRPGLDTIRHFLPGVPDVRRREISARLIREEIDRTEGTVEVPGAAALVTSLIDDGVPVALVTSASEDLMRVRMGAAGVPVPATIVCAGDVSRGKPAPDGYLYAARLLGVASRSCAVLEDSPAGVSAARSAGSQVVVVGTSVPDGTDAIRLADLRGVRVRRPAAVTRPGPSPR